MVKIEDKKSRGGNPHPAKCRMRASYVYSFRLIYFALVCNLVLIFVVMGNIEKYTCYTRAEIANIVH